jgi:OH-DDVA meta-cleavage compound hydrolase
VIIDIHGHLNAPGSLYAGQSMMLAARGAHGRENLSVSEDELYAFTERTVRSMDEVGTDLQIVSPRPFALMHSESPAKIVHWWAEANNDTIARQVSMFPARLVGMGAMPQAHDEDPVRWLPELERCVKDLGFVGVLLNPDPSEGQNLLPNLGDEYWYPVYDKLVELGIPALVHSTACKNARETYSSHFSAEETIAILSVLNSRVFLDFPGLQLIISHGGGSVPYQIGRWRAGRLRQRNPGGLPDATFDDSLRRFWFDTCLYSDLALELLFRTVGTGRCLFGTERPGTGSVLDPSTGHMLDDVKYTIDNIPSLTEAERAVIYSGNALSLFNLAARIGAARP